MWHVALVQLRVLTRALQSLGILDGARTGSRSSRSSCRIGRDGRVNWTFSTCCARDVSSSCSYRTSRCFGQSCRLAAEELNVVDRLGRGGGEGAAVLCGSRLSLHRWRPENSPRSYGRRPARIGIGMTDDDDNCATAIASPTYMMVEQSPRSRWPTCLWFIRKKKSASNLIKLALDGKKKVYNLT